MRVALSTYGDLETDGRTGGEVADPRRGMPVCAPPDCAELLDHVGVRLVPIGAWR